MVEVKNLTFSYGKERLFDNLSMELVPGNIYGLLGLNGAGKTTLLKLIAGLLFPMNGETRVAGFISGKRDPRMLSEVFIMPEELNLPGISAREYLATMSPFYPRFDHEQFKKYLNEFKLPENKLLTKYSFGMKKKFVLSFGLASGTKLLIMDEPTNGLDIPAKGQFRRLVAEAAAEDRIFIISTHQVRDVENLIDPLIIVHRGEVLYNLSLEQIGNKILMVQSSTSPDATKPGFLYSEPCVGGFWVVQESGLGSGTRLDLEVLFNMSVNDPLKTKRLFSGIKEAV